MLNDTIERIDRFASEREWDQFHSPKNLAASISIEANELLEIFQWNDLSRQEIAEDKNKSQEISEEISNLSRILLNQNTKKTTSAKESTSDLDLGNLLEKNKGNKTDKIDSAIAVDVEVDIKKK